ncbi:MAG: hypothetical protein K2M46_02550 [Lachnospiraceae bacterium]|nr:hypothetical protein [Lachnospiraceae bacterium]
MEKWGKVDKGFELCYYNLSYRRKFIRTLWLIPWVLLAPILVYIWMDSLIISIALAVVLVVIEIIQATYNYRKWKA